ncbi:MAG: HAD-IA family hydrolase [Lentisphaeria bacterium]|nr:HAD-IA family hydrolase [Lentisphaeria bacterium]
MADSMILFDLDGTLVDSRADLAAAVNRMRGDHGLAPLPFETVITFVGNGITALVERSLGDARGDISMPKAVDGMRAHYMAHLLDNTQLYPGVVEALTTIEGLGYPMAVVTNKPEAPAREICQVLGIADFFDSIVGGDTFPVLKPEPDPLLGALKQSDCSPAGSWMVGDNYTDLASGAAAGLSCCFCRYGFGDPRQERFAIAIDALPELSSHLRTL